MASKSVSLSRARAPCRTLFTRKADELAELLRVKENIEGLEDAFEQLEVKRSQLDQYDQDIYRLLLEDESVTDEQLMVEAERSSNYQDRFIALRNKFRRYVAETNEEVSPAENAPVDVETARSEPGISETNNVRLPKLGLPIFSGERRLFFEWWGLFEVSIHKNSTLSSAEKFAYLKKALEDGEANSVVSGRQVWEYSEAIDLLQSEYGDKEYIEGLLMEDLWELKPLNEKDKLAEQRVFINKLEKTVRGLRSLGIKTREVGRALKPVLYRKLPFSWRLQFERFKEENQRAKADENLTDEAASVVSSSTAVAEAFEQLLSFMRKEISMRTRAGEESEGVKLPTAGSFHVRDRDVQEPRSKNDAPKEWKPRPCIFCERSHESKDCRIGAKMSLSERKQLVERKRVCFSCLKPNHFAKDCKRRPTCVVCSKGHHAILCPGPGERKKDSCEKEKGQDTTGFVSSKGGQYDVCLPVINVWAISNGKKRSVYALIDSGCQNSYVTEKLMSSLELKSVGEEFLRHTLFGGNQTEAKHHQRVRFEIAALNGQESVEIESLVEKTLCGRLKQIPYGPWVEEFAKKGVKVPWFAQDNNVEIDVVLGADVAADFLIGERVAKSEYGPVAIKGDYGLFVMGKYPCASSSVEKQCLFRTSTSEKEYWELESLGIKDPIEVQTQEEIEEETMKHFKETVQRDEESGRYIVALPWIDSEKRLPVSFDQAFRRLLSLTRKLVSQGKYDQYNQMFEDWVIEGIIEEVPENELNKKCGVHYLAHRAVFREDKETTKCRPVFDASAGKPSLNDSLYKGPNLMTILTGVLNRFRMFAVGLAADLQKAFLQIMLRKEDRDFTRFLWWTDSAQEKLRVFRFKRVVWGVASSPFHLNAVVQEHLKNEQENFPSTAEKLARSLFVDDCLLSTDSLEEAQILKKETTTIFSKAGFCFKKWMVSGDEGEVSVLGVVWDSKKDTLSPQVKKLEIPFECRVSKRVILSFAQRVFDPVGVTYPALLLPKLLIQKLWIEKASWDDPVSSEMSEIFLKWAKQLPELMKIRIPRHIAYSETSELHVFQDASTEALGVCVFMRTETSTGEVIVRLVGAKTKVAPIQKATVPRLELVACVMGVRFANTLCSELDFNRSKVSYWTDSATALAWIRRDKIWAVFVRNRVEEIRKTSQIGQWSHCPGALNPADLPSRGCSPEELVQSKWWEGPAWLRNPKESWPKGDPVADENLVSEELKKTATVAMVSVQSESLAVRLAKRFSSFTRIVRYVCWIRRMITAKIEGKVVSKESISSEELERAEIQLWKLVQREAYEEEMSGEINKDSSIFKLKPFVKDGLIRIETRVIFSGEDERFCKPIVLPGNHPLVSRKIEEEHRRLCHANAGIVLASLRDTLWITDGRRNVRSVVKSCGKCRRFSVKPMKVSEAPLPAGRCTLGRVFQVVGVDYAGPVFLKDGKKAWIAIFTCAVYRAVHFELVSSLSTEHFLLAFQRFVSRRGRPQTIYSDNGTNFVGAENHLKEIDWDVIERDPCLMKIAWIKNAPASPWWGGFFERIVRMLKELIRRSLGRSILSAEHFYTVLVRCEGVLNGRPLTVVSDDNEDLKALTPNHFLLQGGSVDTTDVDFVVAEHFKKQASVMSNMFQSFQSRFRNEYLGILAKRSVLENDIPNVGDVVLVVNEGKRISWPLGIIVELLFGSDGLVRAVTLKVGDKTVVRPLQKLCLLESRSLEQSCVSKKCTRSDFNWVQCDSCDEWFHWSCVGFTDRSADFICSTCKNGPSSRNR